MPWLAVILEVEAAFAEQLGDALLQAGALAVDIADATAGTSQERPLFAEASAAAAGAWAHNRLTALFAVETDLSAAVPASLHAAGLRKTTPYRVERVDDRDWVRLSQDQFAPIRISPRLWIVPSWHTPPDSRALNIVLDPGLAFGTGTHPTTALCLEWLDRLDLAGKTLLDYGCGSGVLAIAALKLGAARAIGVDNDPQALIATRDNAARNEVSDGLHVCLPNELSTDAQADLFVANILAGPLAELAPRFAALCKPAAPFALSGILAGQEGELLDRYRACGFVDLRAVHREDWVRIEGMRE